MSADRVRRHRERRRRGEAVFRVQAPAFDLADRLIEAGWLAAWDAEDRAKIEEALGRAVKHMIDEA